MRLSRLLENPYGVIPFAFSHRNVTTPIRSLIEKHDERILDVATTRYITFSPASKVSELIRRFRNAAKDAEVVMYIYVTDVNNRLVGVVDIKEILQANLDDTMEDLMTTNIVSLDESDTIASAYKLFSRYSFRAIPVVGEGHVLKGAVPYRDIMQLSHRSV